MNRLIISLLFASSLLVAQDVTTILSSEQLALTNNTIALTVTATTGDGSTCSIIKQSGMAILATFTCKSGDGNMTLVGSTVRAGGTAVQTMNVNWSDVLCLIGINPGTAASASMGSLGVIPARGLAWSCSTNIRAAGVITGQTAPVNGSVVWP